VKNTSVLRRFVTPQINEDLRLTQTFRVRSPELSAVQLRPSIEGDVSGRIRLELTDLDRDGRGTPKLIRRAEIDAATLATDTWYRFEFPPVADSDDHVFRLDASSVPEYPARGVGFLATRGTMPDGGLLLANDRHRWATLIFRTETPATSVLAGVLGSRYLSRRRAVAALAAWTVVLLGVGLMLRAVLTEVPA
jgi:hypothetical protein